MAGVSWHLVPVWSVDTAPASPCMTLDPLTCTHTNNSDSDMLPCTLTVMMTTIFDIGDDRKPVDMLSQTNNSYRQSVHEHCHCKHAGHHYNSTVGLQYLQGRVFDGDHGDWTMTEKVSSKLSLI